MLLVLIATACGARGSDHGTIVFESDRSGPEALYAVDPVDGVVTRLSALPRSDVLVYWARDGSKALIYDYSRGTILDLESGTRRIVRLPLFEAEQPESVWLQAQWSPDARRLAYASENGAIVIVNLASGRRRVVAHAATVAVVAWSPDGKRVALHDWRRQAVWTAPADGGPATPVGRVPQDVPPNASPAWSADGNWISLGQSTLLVAKATGSPFRLLARHTTGVAWAPIGNHIAFAAPNGIVVADMSRSQRRQLTHNRGDSDPAWSPDGSRIVFDRRDGGSDLVRGDEVQLWTVRADGTQQRPLTHAFPDGGHTGPAVWMRGRARGAPPPRLRLVSPHGVKTLETRLPIVALTAAGVRAALAQGYGERPGFPHPHPIGSIIAWNAVTGTTDRVATPTCLRGRYEGLAIGAVVLLHNGIGYLCRDEHVSYGEDDTLRLVQPEKRRVVDAVHTSDGEFGGSWVSGLADDGTAAAYAVNAFAATLDGRELEKPATVWETRGARSRRVATFPHSATVESLSAGRVAVETDPHTIVVLAESRRRAFAFDHRLSGATLDGPRLVVLEGRRLDVIDLRSGRTTASWPVRLGFASSPALADARGDIAVYVAGAAVHVMRLADGREVVLDTPEATAPVLARMGSQGLFYSFTESYSRRPGRLSYVTLAELDRDLRSGR
jgi:hypothetical protein